jgi:hypothetical protein
MHTSDVQTQAQTVLRYVFDRLATGWTPEQGDPAADHPVLRATATGSIRAGTCLCHGVPA